jgi:hypothetical protein
VQGSWAGLKMKGKRKGVEVSRFLGVEGKNKMFSSDCWLLTAVLTPNSALRLIIGVIGLNILLHKITAPFFQS